MTQGVVLRSAHAASTGPSHSVGPRLSRACNPKPKAGLSKRQHVASGASARLP
jgi:hypothetical protein